VTEHLKWPAELASQQNTPASSWFQPGNNIALDFHGDPYTADITLLSDGNHHMALQETLAGSEYAKNIFYVTLPPQVLLQIIINKEVYLGNLRLPVQPHIILSPATIIDTLLASGKLSKSVPFIKNRGNVLLIRKGNPKNIFRVEDILRDDIRLFISNASTEKASHLAYRDTLNNIAQNKQLEEWLESGSSRIMFGKKVHHREAPQALFENHCDVAILYYHLALRFVRIFPDDFEIIPLGGTADDPQPGPENVISDVHMGLFTDTTAGEGLFDYLQSQTVKDIYRTHGLQEI